MTAHAHIDFIDSTEGLRSLCRELGRPPWIALDTEFLRERTYFPKFCLLQIATEERVACIDPLSCADLTLLDPLLDDPGVLKVFHAARQDLEILFRLRRRLPQPLFDTQLAAPYIGLPEQMGYAALAGELLGARLDKGHTRTDWSARPLSNAQLRYACDDVLYLGQIYLRLSERLLTLDRRVWAEEEMASLTDPALYDPDPRDAWLRIGGSAQLNQHQAALLMALAAWREELARTLDCPRNWVVKDEVLLELVRQRPVNLQELQRIRVLDERTCRRFGEDLLAIVRAAAETPSVDRLPKTRPASTDNPTHEALLEVFSALLRLKGAEYELNPALIGSRRELREFIADPEGSPLLKGWRRTVAGLDLLAMLTGTKSLRVVDGVLRISDDEGQ